MKMKDRFPEVFQVNGNPSFGVQNCVWTTFGEDEQSTEDQDSAIEHAVLNHDRMAEENKKLLIALCDIQGMCIGDVAMGYKLDPESIGMMIYEATGMTHPELSAKLNQEGEE